MPRIHKITVYPIKSLDGTEVAESRITPGGALAYDRAWALYNEAGKTINAKKYPQIQQIRTSYDLEKGQVSFSNAGQHAAFSLWEEAEPIAAFFSDYLREKVYLKQNLNAGFPDDDVNSGPTLLSTATYEFLQQWFSGLTLDNLRRRFRANIELGECPEPFWEDRLLGEPGTDYHFRLGEVQMIGKQACARCPVPTRDPDSGVPDAAFARTFAEQRQRTFPSFANLAQFNHFYRLSINTIIPSSEAGKVLRLSDDLML